jgi:PAS domain S-box-containing protein
MDPEGEARSILDRLNTAVLTCDEQLRVASMNPAAETMFGISARQAYERPLSSLLAVEPEMLLQPVTKAQTTR